MAALFSFPVVQRAGIGRLLVLALALLQAVSLADSPDSGSSTGHLERVVLQLRYRHQFQFAGFYAAVEQGYYREAGLDVVLREGGAGVDPVEEVLRGRADYGISGAELVMEYAKGKPVVALAALFQHNPSVFLVLGNSGIQTPQHLYGKRAMIRNGPLSAALVLMLVSEGVPLDSVELLPNSGNLEDLIEGRVDAFSGYLSNQPYALRKRGIPFHVLNPVDYGVDFYGDCLFTSRREAADNVRRAAALRAASLKGWAYAMAHPDEMIGLILRTYAPDSDPDKLAFEAAETRRLILPDEIDIGHMNPSRWAVLAQRLHDAGLIDKEIDEQALSARFLFDPNDTMRKSRGIRFLWWGLGIFAAALLILLLMILSLKRAVRNRTSELAAANRGLVRENEERRKAQALLRLQHELVMRMASRETVRDSLGILLDMLVRIPGVEAGGVYLVDEKTGSLELVVYQGISEKFASIVRHVEGGSPRARLVMEGRTIFLGNDSPLIGEGSALDAEGLHSTLVAPFKWDNRVMGSLNMSSRTLEVFPEDTVMAVEAAGMQIGGIIARLRATEALRESELKFRNLADSALDAILVGDENGRFVYANPAATGLTGYAIEELVGQPFSLVVHPDELKLIVRRFKARIAGESAPPRYESFFIRKDGTTVPIEFSARRILWGGRHADMAYCIDRSERKRLEGEILKISQWEKQRIGHDLHDALGQQLAGIAYLCQALGEDLADESSAHAAKAAELGALLRTAIEQVRRIVRGLAPVAMEEGGLSAGLRWLANEAVGTMGIECRFVDALKTPVRNAETAAHLYHIAQEALTNAVRHGKARKVTIRLEGGDDQRGELVVEDNGTGLRPGAGSEEGSGLKIMRYRADMVGGTLSLTTNGAGGLTVHCTFAGSGDERNGREEWFDEKD